MGKHVATVKPLSTVLLERRAGVATIRLNRPEKRNSLDLATKELLITAIASAVAEDDVRVIVITGTGSAFCAGADLTDLSRRSGDAYRTELRRLQDGIIAALVESPKPVIGALNGVAAGGGIGLALACDILVAARSAYFAPSFVTKVGVAADLGTATLLPDAVGVRRAAAMLLFDEQVDAMQAQQWGLVHRVVANEDLSAVVEELASRAARSAPLALAATKHLLQFGRLAPLQAFLEAEAVVQTELRATADHAEALAAFAERRRPWFLGC